MTENPYSLTVKDACKVAGGISRMTLYRRIASGNFPEPRRFSARCIRWSQAQIDAWLKDTK